MDAFLEEIKRSDQPAQCPYSTYSLPHSKGTRQTERLDLLGVVRPQHVLTGSTLTFTYRSSRTVCNCYGRLVSVLYRSREDFQRFPAYEGQSGSKDRGDPEVLEYLRAPFYLDQ